MGAGSLAMRQPLSCRRRVISLHDSGGLRMRIRISRYFLKLLGMSVLLGAVPVIILGIFSYAKSSESIKEKVIRSNEMILSQVHLRTEKELRMVDKMMNQFMYSKVVTQSLNKAITQHDFQDVWQIQQEISFMQSYELGIKDVVLVNLQQNWYISGGVQLSSFAYYTDKDLFAKYEDPKYSFYPYVVTDDTVTVVKRCLFMPPNRSPYCSFIFPVRI
jgi:hypothetical protein